MVSSIYMNRNLLSHFDVRCVSRDIANDFFGNFELKTGHKDLFDFNKLYVITVLF